MTSEASFEEILRQKIQSQDAFKVASSSTFPSHSTSEQWIFELSSERKKSFKSRNLAFTAYASQSVSSTSQEPTSRQSEILKEEPLIEERQASPDWSFEQQLAIDQLIRLGANLRLDSHFADIKKAYKKLIRVYHPDTHQDKEPQIQKQLQERLQLAIECFRIIEQV